MLKNRLKVLFILSAILIQGFIFVPRVVLASDYQLSNFAGIAGYDITDPSNSTLEGLTQTVISVALSILGIVFLGFALYAGMRWMTAQGNEENVTRAKDTLQAAIIGMIVVSLSYAITVLVFGLLSNSASPSPKPNPAPKTGQGGGNEVTACSSYTDCDTNFQLCFNGACIDQTPSNCSTIGPSYVWANDVGNGKCVNLSCKVNKDDCYKSTCSGAKDVAKCNQVCDNAYLTCATTP